MIPTHQTPSSRAQLGNPFFVQPTEKMDCFVTLATTEGKQLKINRKASAYALKGTG